LTAEARHEVTEAAVTVAKLLSDLRHRLVLAEDRAESLIAALEPIGRLEEEGFAQGVVHG
jgi:hypothetical protein